MNHLSAAENYLQNTRGFNLELIKGMYYQAERKRKDGTCIQTVRFPLWGNSSYDHFIEKDEIEGRKGIFSFGTSFLNRAWIPKEMAFNEGDTIYITETILDAIELLHERKKAIASLSAVNLPFITINYHCEKKITWVLYGDKVFLELQKERCIKELDNFEFKV